MASVAAGPQNPGNVNYFFHIIVFLCITFLFGKLDPIAPLTPFGMNTIGVFLGVIYAWVFIDIIWPSMVGLLALMLLDVLPATALLNKGFGDPTVIMMMFIFVFSATLERYGLAKYISLWFVSRKCVMGKPWRLTFALLLAIAILGGHSEEVNLTLPSYSLGYVSDEKQIVAIYNSADAFVLPSLEDNLPNTIMESMACGVPSIGFRVGGIPEMIDHQQNGYVANYRDTEDLASGIHWVLEEADRAALKQACLQKVAQNYSQHAVALKYIEVYNEAMAYKNYKL